MVIYWFSCVSASIVHDLLQQIRSENVYQIETDVLQLTRDFLLKTLKEQHSYIFIIFLLLYTLIILCVYIRMSPAKFLRSCRLLLPFSLSGSKAQVVRETSMPAVWGRRTSPETWQKDDYNHMTVWQNQPQSIQPLRCFHPKLRI